MFACKKNYFLIIDSIKNFDLRNIKKYNKFSIIYRNTNKEEKVSEIRKFRNNCKIKKIKFFIANNLNLMISTNSDGIYISASNKSYKSLNLNKTRFKIIGSAHNTKEINFKQKQGCSKILFSKLFLVDYDKKSPCLGVLKFNNFSKISNKLIALGGIKSHNLNHLRNVSCKGFALLSEIKKKPANIISRLF